MQLMAPIALLTAVGLVAVLAAVAVLLWLIMAVADRIMRRRNSGLIRAAAFHEAGHVVVARTLGLPVGAIWVQADGGGGAEIGPSDHLPLVDRIAALVAGTEAVDLFKCTPPEHSAATDHAAISKLVAHLSEDESLSVRNAAYGRARSILWDRLAEVEPIARQLIKHRRIEANE